MILACHCFNLNIGRRGHFVSPLVTYPITISRKLALDIRVLKSNCLHKLLLKIISTIIKNNAWYNKSLGAIKHPEI